MLNYLKKFTMEILPSVAATIIGAYIVNHYIVARPAANAPAVAVSPALVKKAESKHNAKPAELASIPESGVKARGISERALLEKMAAERPAEVKPIEPKQVEPKHVDARATETKPTEVKPTETASLPADSHRHPAPPVHEKTVAKAAPAQINGPAETAAAPGEDHAAELARAAIERLRANGDGAPHVQEAARAPEPPRVEDAPRTALASPVQPLPPPITVSTPAPVETYNAPNGSNGPANPPAYTASIANSDPNRPIPPADIPPPAPQRPIDLRASANDAVARTTTVAHDMLSAAKSMFQAVLPGGQKLSDPPADQNFTD